MHVDVGLDMSVSELVKLHLHLVVFCVHYVVNNNDSGSLFNVK